MLRHWSLLVPTEYVNRHPKTLSNKMTEPDVLAPQSTFTQLSSIDDLARVTASLAMTDLACEYWQGT